MGNSFFIRMSKITIILVLLNVFVFSNKIKAQYTTHALIHGGYSYLNGSYGEVGAKLLWLKNDDFIYRLGGSALLGNRNQKFTVMPKIQGDVLINTTSNVDIKHAYYFLLGTDLSTEYIAPKLGVSLFGIADFSAGYAFPIKNNKYNQALEGIYFQLLFNIPTVIF